MDKIELNITNTRNIKLFFCHGNLECCIKAHSRSTKYEESTIIHTRRIYACITKLFDAEFQSLLTFVTNLKNTDVSLGIHSIHVMMTIHVVHGFCATDKLNV